MYKCRQCDHELNDSQVHCGNCGVELEPLSDRERDYAKEYAKSREPKQRHDNIQRKRARRKMGCKPNDGKEVDHIKPLSKGGSNDKSNLRVVSKKTNRKKGTRSI